MAYQLKHIIKTFQINAKRNRIALQIKHPENCEVLTGIACSVSFCSYVSNTSEATGNTSLVHVTRNVVLGSLEIFHPKGSDTLYSEKVQIINFYSVDYTTNETGTYTNIDFYQSERGYQSVCIPVTETYLDLYYEDQYNVNASSGDKIFYTVNVYFRYKRKPEERRTNEC